MHTRTCTQQAGKKSTPPLFDVNGDIGRARMPQSFGGKYTLSVRHECRHGAHTGTQQTGGRHTPSLSKMYGDVAGNVALEPEVGIVPGHPRCRHAVKEIVERPRHILCKRASAHRNVAVTPRQLDAHHNNRLLSHREGVSGYLQGPRASVKAQPGTFSAKDAWASHGGR